MKKILLVRVGQRCLRTSMVCAGVLFLAGCFQPARGASAADWLENGIYTEETKGDLEAAAEIYRRILEDPRAERSLVAQAQLRLGLCQLKLGNKPQAIAALDRLIQEFPDKDKLLAIMERHMPRLLDEILGQIERNYIQEIDRGELMETAMRAIVGQLDARGGFLRPQDMEFFGAQELSRLNEQIEQQLAGIGVRLKTNAAEVVVESPLPGSPALQAGLWAGDRIVTIDGATLPESNRLEAAANRLRGPAGSAVMVGVGRPASAELLEFQVIRGRIDLPSVLGDRRKPDNTWEFMLDEQRKIGYVRLAYIGKRSAEEMRSALEELVQRGLQALIFDLRNAPGGLLEGAVAVSDLFVDHGRIVTVKGRSGESVFDATPGGARFPVALLVNRKTASAAEIIAACLQDHRRAVVIGERTFGQGIVKNLFQLQNGVGALKIPVAAFYRPSGKPMNRYPGSKDSEDWGVRPDPGFDVALADEELKQYETDRAARDLLSEEEEPKTTFHDRQLGKAVEYILARTGP